MKIKNPLVNLKDVVDDIEDKKITFARADSICDYVCEINPEIYVAYASSQKQVDQDFVAKLDKAFFYLRVCDENYEYHFKEIGEIIFFLAKGTISKKNAWAIFEPIDSDSSYLFGEIKGPLKDGDIYLHTLKVREEFQRKGYGKSILNWLMSLTEVTKRIILQIPADKEKEWLMDFYKKTIPFKKVINKKKSPRILDFRQ